MTQRQITFAHHGHILTNGGAWSPDGAWIVYDIRSDAAGSVFDGTRIEAVEVATGRVEVLYESVHGACCGVVTASPIDDRVVFILGPEHPTADWQYGPARRRGVIVRCGAPGVAEDLDARDLVAPFTPGALRGGTHLHQFSPDGRMVSFTYEDALLDTTAGGGGHEHNLRAVGVSVCGRGVTVPRTHPRNHDGTAWSVLVSKVGSDSASAKNSLSMRQETVTAIQRLRDSVSGVSLDEEAGRLMQFQRAYEANARFFAALDSSLSVLMQTFGAPR